VLIADLGLMQPNTVVVNKEQMEAEEKESSKEAKGSRTKQDDGGTLSQEMASEQGTMSMAIKGSGEKSI
jgi:hypothetical protein